MSITGIRRGKYIALSLLACVLLAPVVHAWAPTRAPAAAAVAKAPPRPLLWKVSDEDNAVYLLGSFHLLKADDYPVSAGMEGVLADAERVVFEVSPSELLDPGLAQKMQSAATFGDERKLSTVMPAELAKRLDLLLGATGSSIAHYEGYKPWYVNQLLVLGLSHNLGLRAERGLDQHLIREATEANKPVAGLETVADQLQALDSVPMEEQVDGLKGLIETPLDLSRELEAIHAAWREGNEDLLRKLTVDAMRTETPHSYRVINVQRNDAWLPQIRKMLDEPGADDVLVVVGAMHLLGSDGVVERLRGMGYTVLRTSCVEEPCAETRR